MRRSTRNIISPALSLPYQRTLNLVDEYTRSINIRPLTIPLPLTSESNFDIEGVRLRLQRNRSFMVSPSNPDPPDFPYYLQQQNTSNIDERIDSLVKNLSDPRPGLLVLLIQPPIGTDFHTNEDSVDGSRPVCGVVMRIGSGKDESDEEDRYERSVIGAFVRRSIPMAIAEEILRVNLVRAIVEAMSYEETDKNSRPCASPSISRDRRFISINTSDLPLCPTVLVDCCRNFIKFAIHIDREIVTNSIQHSDDPNRECKCWKIYQKETQKTTANDQNIIVIPSKASSGYYQFWLLSCQRIKNSIANAIPRSPSPSVIKFFLGTTQLVDKIQNSDSDDSNRKTSELNHRMARSDPPNIDIQHSVDNNKKRKSVESDPHKMKKVKW